MDVLEVGMPRIILSLNPLTQAADFPSESLFCAEGYAAVLLGTNGSSVVRSEERMKDAAR